MAKKLLVFGGLALGALVACGAPSPTDARAFLLAADPPSRVTVNGTAATGLMVIGQPVNLASQQWLSANGAGRVELAIYATPDEALAAMRTYQTSDRGAVLTNRTDLGIAATMGNFPHYPSAVAFTFVRCSAVANIVVSDVAHSEVLAYAQDLDRLLHTTRCADQEGA
ncbi:MAG TPA: hypothetical protein VGE07_30940 [Herpetosiphonaceae bacterium]